MLHCVAVCCSMLHCVAVCCSMLHCVAVCCSMLHCIAVCCSRTRNTCPHISKYSTVLFSQKKKGSFNSSKPAASFSAKIVSLSTIAAFFSAISRVRASTSPQSLVISSCLVLIFSASWVISSCLVLKFSSSWRILTFFDATAAFSASISPLLCADWKKKCIRRQIICIFVD